MTRRLAHLAHNAFVFVSGMMLVTLFYLAGFQHGKLRAERPVENDKVLADMVREEVYRATVDYQQGRTDSIKARVRECGPLREC